MILDNKLQQEMLLQLLNAPGLVIPGNAVDEVYTLKQSIINAQFANEVPESESSK
jgi:hypothetical protein